MNEISVYAGLFLTALTAATILPMQSETVLVALLLADTYPPWLLGRMIERFRNRSWFPASDEGLARAALVSPLREVVAPAQVRSIHR